MKLVYFQKCKTALLLKHIKHLKKLKALRFLTKIRIEKPFIGNFDELMIHYLKILRKSGIIKICELNFDSRLISKVSGHLWGDSMKSWYKIIKILRTRFVDDKPCTAILASLRNLQNLILGISFPSIDIMEDFFKNMKPLKTLKYFTLQANIASTDIMYSTSMKKVNALEDFLKSQKSLESIEIFWDQISLLLLEKFCALIPTLKQNIKFFKLSFLLANPKNRAICEKMLVELSKSIPKINNIEKIVVDIVKENNKTWHKKSQAAAIAIKTNSGSKVCFRSIEAWDDVPFPKMTSEYKEKIFD